jgi:type I restriction enzyme R subunit
MTFNEDTRVKIPAILTLTRMGYGYLSLKTNKYDKETNIFTDIFIESIKKINLSLNLPTSDIEQVLKEISIMLDHEDLGKAFYERLTATSGIRLIDFDNFENNSFNVVTELPCKNGEDEFRPDVTLLINGLPLCFVEVKKPNNKNGVQAERDRMINARFQNKKFRKFINITQMIMYSNNMEYDDTETVPLSGSFYSTTSKNEVFFNHFREEKIEEIRFILKPENNEIEKFILKDNNLITIKDSPEFITNKHETTPTNRMLLSLFSKDRLKLFLKYGIAYVERECNEVKKLEKHIMRYPQFFASKAIQDRLEESKQQQETAKGIIWHTQGSGKTALAYFNVKWLIDYYQKQNIIPKFYFVVDRLDLLTQACNEFTARGLSINTVNSKEEFTTDIKKMTPISNLTGKNEITVVNIQKFSEDATAKMTDYNINVQRIYFIDEAHRSYNEKGTFLPNLVNSDKNAVFISLTGTPLIGKAKSTNIWGDYIHKYYYNSSIADRYTLKLIREDIETQYKSQLSEILAQIQVMHGDIDPKKVYAHRKFAEEMLDYIVGNLSKSRVQLGDDTIGGMVVCNSSEQAKMFFQVFTEKYANKPFDKHSPKTAEIILHDAYSTEERKDKVSEFKKGDVDLLFVFNMLLTGFDSPRLKKLYIGRQIKDHNLLQTLTRVNRPYENFRYKAYWDELQGELGDEMQHYSDLFKTQEEIEKDLKEIKETLWVFNTENAEIFQQEISKISDKTQLLAIKKALVNAKELYNIIRFNQYDEILEKLDFKKLRILLREVEHHIALINQKEALENGTDTTSLLNEAIEDIIFVFRKRGESELKLADDLRDIMRKARESLRDNFDKKDPYFISLKEELESIFRKGNLDEITQEEMKVNIPFLRKIYDHAKELNRKNALISAKYNHDKKYARIHKRVKESGLTEKESEIQDVLLEIKKQADESILNNKNILDNENFFSKMVQKYVVTGFQKLFKLDAPTARKINNHVVEEYINEYNGECA